MRTQYGKLLHLLQDAQSSEVQELLGFAMVKPIRTVHDLLNEKGGLQLLTDKLMPMATFQIDPTGKSRKEIEKLTRLRRDAHDTLVKRYAKKKEGEQGEGLSDEDVRNVLASINDNHSFLQSNRVPVDQMLGLLKKYFNPDQATKPWSLAISNGTDGSCLSHDHRTQFSFVYQSLSLWRDIMHEMFKLWICAESDMLDDRSSYRLRNTGQGLQRMQGCPRVGRAMSEIVHGCHQKMRSWIGLSVVHLGDRDVPNALIFIDKYNQVARILTPIVSCIRELDRIYKDPHIKVYLDKSFGGLEETKLHILSDFFKHGFDGSGDDGGSCIDGRLTSAWNWCSRLEKKSYYHVFLLTGFIGFDGEF